MKNYSGSLQKKGRRYYLVATLCGKQKWIALHTTKLNVARIRAAEVAPADNMDAIAWLRKLVKLGEEARSELARQKTTANLGWNGLWQCFNAKSQYPIPAASVESYKRWLQLLADTVRDEHIRAATPAQLASAEALMAAASLRKRYISAPRMITFYNRVWKTLFPGSEVWKSIGTMRRISSTLSKEHYRRLSLPEIRKVLSRLKAAKCNDYADMVVIGYYTGLRLSDVAELECGEVSSDGMSLRIMPNKVRHSRAMFLSVPLIHGARECVQRRLKLMRDGVGTDADRDGHGYLFPKNARRRPSRPISAAFRACGVLKIGNGRASFHSLRATFISLMDEAGVSPHITDAITGHSSGGMHARYTQPTPSALLAAVQGALPIL